MRKQTQISFAVTAKLISAFVFATRIVQSLYFLYIRNFKPLAILCGCTARFVSNLVGNPEDRFSHNEAQLQTQDLLEEPTSLEIMNTSFVIFREHCSLNQNDRSFIARHATRPM